MSRSSSVRLWVYKQNITINRDLFRNTYLGMLSMDAKTTWPIRKKILPLILFGVEGVGLSLSCRDGLTRGQRPRTTGIASERHC